MKKSKKAQISNTFSWFVATIVIFFILLIFVFFVSLKDLLDKRGDIPSMVSLVETKSFLNQEEQRRLFILLEEELDNKKFFDIYRDFNKILENKKSTSFISVTKNAFLLDKKSKEYVNLEESIKENLKEKQIFCQNYSLFVVLKETKLALATPSSAYTGVDDSGFEIFYYFRYPERNFPREIIDYKGSILENNYFFFFPEKYFALIKYFIEECQNEK
ncbi:MAG: hypothetical protein QW103_02720 [Candidatus Pacearchaeota archaeon]